MLKIALARLGVPLPAKYSSALPEGHFCRTAVFLPNYLQRFPASFGLQGAYESTEETMSSQIGKNVIVSIFGQSHSAAIGAVIDGLPAGFTVDLKAVQAFLARRAPGKAAYATARREADLPIVLSGLADGKTCGAPLCAIIQNGDTRSRDYEKLRDVPRPGHADFTAQFRYGGHQDTRGGGHFSGRLTAPLCFAGAICLQMLEAQGIQIGAHIASIVGVADTPFDPVSVCAADLQAVRGKPFAVLDDAAGAAMQQEIAKAKAELDSVGGVIECAAIGLPAGIGDPMFGGLENRLAAALFGIPAVKGLEFGAGFSVAGMRGSQNNDPFYLDGSVKTRTNHAGGILGGISTGMPLLFRLAVKPTPSIAQPQDSISFSANAPELLEIAGRHDPCILPRAVPVVEAVSAIVLLDLLMDAHEPQMGRA